METLVGLRGQTYSIDDSPFKSGGEGGIYKIRENYNLVAKIYKDKTNLDVLENKIKAMVKNPPYSNGDLAWPVDLLYSSSHHFVGFVMKLVSAKDTAVNIFNSNNRYHYSWDFFVRIARNLATVVYNIHELGYCIGDFNSKNIHVYQDGRITLVDTDSFHIRDKATGHYYPCTVAKPEYIAPELIGVKFSDLPPEKSFNEYTDCYSLAVLIFQLLIGGAHPCSCTNGYNQDNNDYSFDNNIKNGVCVYFPETYRSGAKINIPRYSPGIDWLPNDLTQLFHRSFVEGYKQPSLRPTPREWYDCLKHLESGLTRCSKNKNHVYPTSAKQCPWCSLGKKSQLNEGGSVINKIPEDHYTLVYKVDNVQIGPAEFYKEDDVVFLRPKHSEPGCYVTPWMRDNRETVSFLMPDHNVVLKATSNYDKHSVSYFVEDEQVGETEEYYVNEPVKLHARYYKTGYKVSEWKGEIPAFGKFTMPDHDIKMTASISVASPPPTIKKAPLHPQISKPKELHTGEVSITYKVGDRRYGSPEYWKPGQLVLLRETPSVLGKKYSPWMLNGKEVKEFVMPPRNLTLISREIPKSPLEGILSEISKALEKKETKPVATVVNISNKPKFSVKYLVNNQQVGDLEFYSSDEVVHLRPRFTKPGFTVTPWMMNGKLAKDFVMPTSNVVISATTNEKRYMVEYEIDGEIGDIPLSLHYPGEKIHLEDLPKIPGRSVVSWKLHSREITDYFEMPSENVVLKAKTKKNTR